MPELKIKYTAVATGQGTLDVRTLGDFTKAVNKDAKVQIETKKAVDQRDTDSWTLTATWEDTASNYPSSPTYPPGVRGTTGGHGVGSQFAGTDGYY